MKTLLLPCVPVTEQTLTCDAAAADSEALSRVEGGKGQSSHIISKKASIIPLILSPSAILKQVK